ncbi:MAG: hypothetical protein KGS72_00800 [Cyanobacteria bacterium REEB67]|nr:hypothetical protein [Cyanobacteria bacterium REEB67]
MTASKRYLPTSLACLIALGTLGIGRAAFAAGGSALDPYIDYQAPKTAKSVGKKDKGQKVKSVPVEKRASIAEEKIVQEEAAQSQTFVKLQGKAGSKHVKETLITNEPKEKKKTKVVETTTKISDVSPVEKEAKAVKHKEKENVKAPAVSEASTDSGDESVIGGIKTIGAGYSKTFKAMSHGMVHSTKAASEALVAGSKKMSTGLSAGAKASGEAFKKGANTVGTGFKEAGDKIKDGAAATGKIAHLSKDDKDPKSEKEAKEPKAEKIAKAPKAEKEKKEKIARAPKEKKVKEQKDAKREAAEEIAQNEAKAEKAEKAKAAKIAKAERAERAKAEKAERIAAAAAAKEKQEQEEKVEKVAKAEKAEKADQEPGTGLGAKLSHLPKVKMPKIGVPFVGKKKEEVKHVDPTAGAEIAPEQDVAAKPKQHAPEPTVKQTPIGEEIAHMPEPKPAKVKEPKARKQERPAFGIAAAPSGGLTKKMGKLWPFGHKQDQGQDPFNNLAVKKGNNQL